ncbi:MAG: MBL fold metallo-hydrolase [Myxococcales bacterium]|nr:MAG: MBL fold metallo-hydrolase [Myxococcales bacterium]
MALSVLFYGTRGQIMSVSSDRLIYGGHTPCLTVNEGEERLIVDAGFGISNLAHELMNGKNGPARNEFHILLSHFHWDHIQGLMYFSPIYFEHNRINVYTPFEVDVVKEVLNLLLDGSYSPFNGLASLPCTWNFVKLNGSNRVGPFNVSFHPTAHIGECYAYRITSDEGRVVYVTDHDARSSPANESLVAWAKDCDILIHEAMFTPSEYSLFPDLGHSSFISAMENAQRIGAPMTLLTHHAARRNDSELAEHERYLEKLFNNRDRKLAFAREGINYRL